MSKDPAIINYYESTVLEKSDFVFFFELKTEKHEQRPSNY